MIQPATVDHPLQTDVTLLLRVLTNMSVNTLEASSAGDEIRIWTEETNEEVAFHAWNGRVIPEQLQARIFQKFFSTKERLARIPHHTWESMYRVLLRLLLVVRRAG